jgi:hypothetical protein
VFQRQLGARDSAAEVGIQESSEELGVPETAWWRWGFQRQLGGGGGSRDSLVEVGVYRMEVYAGDGGWWMDGGG